MTFKVEDRRGLERAAWANAALATLRAALYALVFYALAFALAAAFLPSIRRWLPLVEGGSLSGSLALAHLYRHALLTERKK